ncbi:MAG: hypothetical protein M5U28_39530 [Sandaracinaceae bacterium]|nr:hypothetical protein [Sandaracinaceae bacterium]
MPPRRPLAADEAPRLAVVVACSDQRTLPEEIFDVGMGELLVAQTPGPFVDESVAATIAFGAHVFEVRLVVVLAHEGCPLFEPPLVLPASTIERQVEHATRAARADGEPIAHHHARAQAARVHQLVEDLGPDVLVVPAVLSKSGHVQWC